MKTKNTTKSFTVEKLIQQLQKFNPKSLVRLDVPISDGDFSPRLIGGDVYACSGGVICNRDNGDPLDVYCGPNVHSGDVIIQGNHRTVIQGPHPKWNQKTGNHYWTAADKKMLRALRAESME